MLPFYGEGYLVTGPKPNLRKSPLSVIRHYLFSISHLFFFLPFPSWGHAVVMTMDLFNMDMPIIILYYIILYYIILYYIILYYIILYYIILYYIILYYIIYYTHTHKTENVNLVSTISKQTFR